MTSLTSISFMGIWGTSNTNVFAVSREGTNVMSITSKIFHYNGDNLTTTTMTSSFLYDIWGSPEGDVFAASDPGILRCANCQQPANKTTAQMCWAGGTCSEVQEYLPVTWDKLTVSTLENQLVIQWDTASETNNLGMNLWCAQLAENQFEGITQLNSQLIPTKAILPQWGASYSSVDYPEINTHLKPGIQHCMLEDVDAGGQCTLHCEHLKTVVIGDDNSIADANLNELHAKARALCNESKRDGVCLAQRLAPN